MNNTPLVEWKILKKAEICSSLTSFCYLCLAEKRDIISFKDHQKLLTVTVESAMSCKH